MALPVAAGVAGPYRSTELFQQRYLPLQDFLFAASRSNQAARSTVRELGGGRGWLETDCDRVGSI